MHIPTFHVLTESRTEGSYRIGPVGPSFQFWPIKPKNIEGTEIMHFAVQILQLTKNINRFTSRAFAHSQIYKIPVFGISAFRLLPIQTKKEGVSYTPVCDDMLTRSTHELPTIGLLTR